MEEKKLTDEAVNATVKSLKWVCNQIPNDLGNSNEEKMLKCIQLYCQQGIAVIERLQSENKELKSPKFASWKLKFFRLKEEFDKELAEHEEFTKKAKAEIERLKIDIKNEKNWGKIQTKQAGQSTAKEIFTDLLNEFSIRKSCGNADVVVREMASRKGVEVE